MAPQPPSGHEDSGLFSRLSSTAGKLECPKTREKDKRERASSCSPKFRKTICEAPNPCAPARPPEPAPRRNMSLSQDSLAAGDRLVEEKKKGRSKFSLKKFLRMGSRKDVDMTGSSSGSRNVEIPSTPQPKPRLEIIHPLELDGAAVQVLRNEKSCGEDSTDSTKSESQSNGWQGSHAAQHLTTARPSKPPPPPRAQSLDESSRAGSSSRGPQQPSGPGASGKPSGAGAKAWQPSGGSSASDSIYANLGPAAAEDVAGVIRSGLAPAKPRRTSSMRDQQPQAQPCSSRPDEELVTVTAGQSRHRGLAERQRTPASDSSVSSEAPTCEYLSTSSIDHDDSSLELRHGAGNHPVTKRQSDSGTLDSAGQHELKFQQPLFIRSSSLPYCMSETEAELRSPFRPYSHNDKVFNAEENWKKEEESRIGRLRQRRGRSIVHRSLEDNYGAVIVANHEALAQFLEQVCIKAFETVRQTNQATPLGTSLRGLKAASLRFRDFNVDRSTALVTGRRVFLSAAWNEQNVTVCVAFEPGMHVSRKEFYLAPIAEFIDTVPKDIAELGYSTGRKTAEATISVLPRLQVNTLKSFAEAIGEAEASIKDENATRESSFVLLQLVSALKSLQARGIEEAPGSLVNVVLCRENKDAYHRLYLFQGLSIDSSENNKDEYVSLCQCALNALEELNLVKKLPLIQELLMREKAITLSQVKSILEFSLWGPADVTLGGPRERETALQRWLDLERATVLHALVRARAQLTVTDEYQLLFLVRTSAKVMCEASLQLDRQRTGLLSVGGIL
ncbi:PREDICTED: serine/arginine repetitive matrix protein 2-like [Ceratosolen solmsi marchali]|uniref:Serine/arginine repetitive matrix protein 2-like n=1 Tax=Ceratosolen solmsi marchali TaxID=326594 RepID=A0AAJ7DYD2_9HYME|nr:PREDICTED: serine/arginine repetitive matrix protein 2-like [Ceratosolen solmsi marchali]